MIRTPSDADSGTILEFLDVAFAPSQNESTLRSSIMNLERPHWEWLAEHDDRIVGHILYTLANDDSGTSIGYHLAPVAIHPDYQKRGLGTQLIRETLTSEALASESIFVLGDPQFYERFRFVKTTSAQCPFDKNKQHFRALRWHHRERPFNIGYEAAFS
jgi:putative acetyltransferase